MILRLKDCIYLIQGFAQIFLLLFEPKKEQKGLLP